MQAGGRTLALAPASRPRERRGSGAARGATPFTTRRGRTAVLRVLSGTICVDGVGARRRCEPLGDREGGARARPSQPGAARQHDPLPAGGPERRWRLRRRGRHAVGPALQRMGRDRAGGRRRQPARPAAAARQSTSTATSHDTPQRCRRRPTSSGRRSSPSPPGPRRGASAASTSSRRSSPASCRTAPSRSRPAAAPATSTRRRSRSCRSARCTSRRVDAALRRGADWLLGVAGPQRCVGIRARRRAEQRRDGRRDRGAARRAAHRHRRRSGAPGSTSAACKTRTVASASTPRCGSRTPPRRHGSCRRCGRPGSTRDRFAPGRASPLAYLASHAACRRQHRVEGRRRPQLGVDDRLRRAGLRRPRTAGADGAARGRGRAAATRSPRDARRPPPRPSSASRDRAERQPTAEP